MVFGDPRYHHRSHEDVAMPLHVTIELPPELEERLRRESPDLSSEVKAAFAVDLFRRGRLSHVELSRILGLDRFETDAWLKSRGVFEGSPTMADLEADRRTLERVMGKAG
jgi:predicted HTH domain antitoxin